MQNNGRVSEENSRLLQVQNPSLASEETWTHATTQPEVGGLLLATSNGPRLAVLNTDQYWQLNDSALRSVLGIRPHAPVEAGTAVALQCAMVLLAQHSAAFSVGLILNRPGGLKLA
ncbi:hypothetical protein COO60DRAFT_1641409 [Scenedesmus sp. NREL 46B-D3]|nr:hypothetical protein COO60DRAFT_1641409 [Scenedesmus sp. NREL 46B-D3]